MNKQLQTDLNLETILGSATGQQSKPDPSGTRGRTYHWGHSAFYSSAVYAFKIMVQFLNALKRGHDKVP